MMHMTHTLRRLALPAALIATLALASCGTGSNAPAVGGGPSSTSGATTSPPVAGPPAPASPTPTATGTRSPVGPPNTGSANSADVDFAMSMITSHLQAGAIADLAPKHAIDNKIKTLAPKVKTAQGPEVTTMAGWLVGAGIPVPDATGGHDMSGMGGTKMQVVISPQEMTALGKATGAGFDRMWLQLMLKSHQGALAMARTEVAKGINPDAKTLAQSIIDRQSGEVATMKSILTGISG
jgi:uncharacterized protein (DUF305 family)